MHEILKSLWYGACYGALRLIDAVWHRPLWWKNRLIQHRWTAPFLSCTQQDYQLLREAQELYPDRFCTLRPRRGTSSFTWSRSWWAMRRGHCRQIQAMGMEWNWQGFRSFSSAPQSERRRREPCKTMYLFS